MIRADFKPQIGPRDLHRHSKWPIFLQLHGSVAPEMILPLIFVGAWATLITCISKFVHNRTYPPITLKNPLYMYAWLTDN